MPHSVQELIALLDALVPGDDVPSRMDELLRELEPLVSHRKEEDAGEASVYWGYRLALDHLREPVIKWSAYHDALMAANLSHGGWERAHALAQKIELLLRSSARRGAL